MTCSTQCAFFAIDWASRSDWSDAKPGSMSRPTMTICLECGAKIERVIVFPTHALSEHIDIGVGFSESTVELRRMQERYMKHFALTQKR